MQTLDARKDRRSDASASAGELPRAAGLGVHAAAVNVREAQPGDAKGDCCPPGVAEGLTALPMAPILVPIRTVSALNSREHWQQRSRRVKKERETVAWYLATRAVKPALPLIVTLTRLGPSNGLDDDNLAGSCKSVRDQIAQWLGVDDRKSEVVRYRYAQERAKEWGVRIQWEAA